MPVSIAWRTWIEHCPVSWDKTLPGEFARGELVYLQKQQKTVQNREVQVGEHTGNRIGTTWCMMQVIMGRTL